AGSIVPYVVNKDKVSLRNFSAIVGQLERFVLVNVQDCVDFSDVQGVEFDIPNIDWKGIGFDESRAIVDYSQRNVDLTVLSRPEREDVVFSLFYPVRARVGDESLLVEEFNVVVPLRFERLYEITRDLAQDIAARNGQTFLLGRLCDKYNVSDNSVNIYSFAEPFEKAYVLKVVDSHSSAYGLSPLQFQVAVRNVEIEGGCFG
ncbi:hypothetical protein D6825_03615, partial [Candidatus Woesearchaeota archaeon]